MKLDMVDFDFIFGMDWLYASYAFIDYRTRSAKFQFPNESILELEGSDSTFKSQFHFFS